MKYFIVVMIAVVILGGFIGFLYFNQGLLVLPSSASNENSGNPALSGDSKIFGMQLNKLQSDLSELKGVLTQQSLAIKKLREDSLTESSRIAGLEKKLQGQNGSLNASNSGELPDQPTDPSELSYQGFSAELFKNPEFAKVFADQVTQVIKDKEKKDRDAQMQRIADAITQTIKTRIDEFAKAQNLNDFQQQELTRLVAERSSKTMALFAQMQDQGTSRDTIRTQMDAIRNESDEKIKQVLQPQQFEEYQKIENQLTRGAGFGPGGGRRPNAAPGANNPAPAPAPTR